MDKLQTRLCFPLFAFIPLTINFSSMIEIPTALFVDHHQHPFSAPWNISSMFFLSFLPTFLIIHICYTLSSSIVEKLVGSSLKTIKDQEFPFYVKQSESLERGKEGKKKYCLEYNQSFFTLGHGPLFDRKFR